MKRYLFVLLLLFLSGCTDKQSTMDLAEKAGAGTKVSDLDALAEAPASDDLFTVIDVSDTTMAATGTNKKITKTNLFSGYATSGANSDITSMTGLTTPLGAAYGGLGVANNAASTWTISGNYATTITLTGVTGVTFPTSGTLATTAQLIGSNEAYGSGWNSDTGLPEKDDIYDWGHTFDSDDDGDVDKVDDNLYATTNGEGYVWVGDGVNYNPVLMSGDASIAADGTVTVTAYTSLGGITELAGGLIGTTGDNAYSAIGPGTSGAILYSAGSGSVPSFGAYLDLPSLTSAPGSPVAGAMYKANNDDWDPADLDGTTDYYVIYDGADYNLWFDDSGNFYFSSMDFSSGTFIMPNGTADATLATAGQKNLNTTDEQLSFHSAADGEISGEVAVSLIQHDFWSFDPAAVYGTTNHRMPLMTIGDDAPEGITIDEWKFTFDANPTAEIDADLKRATAFIGVGSAAVIDQLDTTDGASSEDTDANINGGAVIANGQVLYIELAPYTETGHTCLLDIWYHYEED